MPAALMATLQDMCTMAREGRGKKVGIWQRRGQTNSWMDGQLVMLNTFHIPLCVISRCLSFPAAIYLFRRRENRLTSPHQKKRLFENKMQWRKLNSITHWVPQLKMNGVKLTPGACLHFPCRHATDQSRNHSEEERQRWQDGWKCQHVPYTHISLNVHQKTPQQHPCCELWVHISLTIFCLFHHHHDHPPPPPRGA